MTIYDFKKLRETDLNIVLTQLFEATETETRPFYATRKYVLPLNQKIAVTGLKWIDNTTSKGGFGAIDLVMHLKSVNLTEAADMLENINNNSHIISQINFFNQNNVIIPQPCKETWYYVKNYLNFLRKIPEYIIDKLYQNSLLWSDNQRNCVFPRDLNTGAYIRGILPNKPFKKTIGQNGRPYVISGDNLIIITEAPIDAISLKFYYPRATIIATGGRIGFDKIQPYLIQADKVLLAQDNDNAGDDQAEILNKFIKANTERLRPLYNLKDWNEVLIYDTKKK
jgi:hypothetical protein